MTETSPADYPVLGFDPSPGDVAGLRGLVTQLKDCFDAVNEISNVLHGADDGEWRGQAAVAFRDLLDDDVRPKVDKTVTAFDGAYHTLLTWTNGLEGYQARSRRYERDAAEAKGRLDAATSDLDGLPDAPSVGDDPDETDRKDANDRRDDAQGDVDRYRGYARAMFNDEYTPKGDELSRRLQDAISIAPEEPGWFDSVMDSIGDFFDAIGDALADLGDLIIEGLHALAPLLQFIGDVAGILSAVLGLLSLIPGLQFLAIPALICAGIALVTHYGARVGETGSFLKPFTEAQFWLDAVSVALGVGGLAVGAYAQSLAVGARGANATAPNFFRLVTNPAVTYTSREMHVLLGSWKITQASFVLDTKSVADFFKNGIDVPDVALQGPVVS